MQNGTNFMLVYMWFDVPSAEATVDHRREIKSFSEILKCDGIAFVSRTYQEVFESLRGGTEPCSPHVEYLLKRYLDGAPAGTVGYSLEGPVMRPTGRAAGFKTRVSM
jgi:hypothetical protein